MAKRTRLTEQQRLFCRYYVEEADQGKTVSATQIAIKAGYAEKAAAQQASRLLKDAKIIQYMDRLRLSVEEIFQQEAKTMLEVLIEIAQDPTAKDASRVSAARDVLDRAGYVAPKKVEAQLTHSGNITSTQRTETEVHIIQQLVNTNEQVAEALMEAVKQRQKSITEVQQ